MSQKSKKSQNPDAREAALADLDRSNEDRRGYSGDPNLS